VAPFDATQKNRNIDAQLQSILYTTAQKRFGKIDCTTFGAQKVVHSEPFSDLDGRTPNPVFKVTAFLKSNISKTHKVAIAD